MDYSADSQFAQSMTAVPPQPPRTDPALAEEAHRLGKEIEEAGFHLEALQNDFGSTHRHELRRRNDDYVYDRFEASGPQMCVQGQDQIHLTMLRQFHETTKTHEATRTTEGLKTVDIVFATSETSPDKTFVEIEDMQGRSLSVGAWRDDVEPGYARLRMDVLQTPETSKALRRTYLDGAIDALNDLVAESRRRGIEPSDEFKERVGKLQAERAGIGA